MLVGFTTVLFDVHEASICLASFGLHGVVFFFVDCMVYFLLLLRGYLSTRGVVEAREDEWSNV